MADNRRPVDSRFCNPVSRAELERRWAAARAGMHRLGLDALVIQGFSNFSGGGYFRWFTGLSAGTGNPNTLVVPREGPFSLICHGDAGGDRRLNDSDALFPNIGRRITHPNFPSARYLSVLDADSAAAELQDRKTVGLVAPHAMYHGFATQLRERLSGADVTDATDMIDELKARKSPEEVQFVREAAAMQDEIMRRLPEYIVPGARDFEVAARAQYIGQMLGSEGGHFHAASAPASAPAVIRQRQQQGRTIERGDVFIFQCENNGPAGYFVHVARMFVLGKASQKLRDLFSLAVAAQDETVALLRKGMAGRDIYDAYNAFMRDHGLAEEKRLHCHAQGYDTVERPLARPEETMSFGPGMNVGIHPGFSKDGMFITICDNFLIGADGGPERLSQIPREIIEI